jgi:hypothetical protein
MNDTGVAGYVGGGFTDTDVTTVDKFVFPSDTRSTLATGLSLARRAFSAMSDEGVF